jgi:hypothetical protein
MEIKRKRIQRYRDIEIQRYRDTEIQRYIDKKLLRYRNTEIQRYRDTEIQRYRNTEIQRFRDTEVQRYGDKEKKDKEIKKYGETEIQRYRDTEIQRYRYRHQAVKFVISMHHTKSITDWLWKINLAINDEDICMEIRWKDFFKLVAVGHIEEIPQLKADECTSCSNRVSPSFNFFSSRNSIPLCK